MSINLTGISPSSWRYFWIFALCLLAYLPAVNNGFISDDFVLLDRIDEWAQNPLLMFQSPPDGFRLTNSVFFFLMRGMVGYQSEYFYLAAILIHFLNCLLVFSLARRLLKDDTAAFSSALLMASFRIPQEAIFWLAALNEGLMTLFALLAILCWISRRFPASGLAYCAALLSKESALLLPFFFLIMERLSSSHPGPRTRWIFPALPGLGFLLTFFLPEAPTRLSQFYQFGPHGFSVLFLSLAKLTMPWLALVLGFMIWKKGHRPERKWLWLAGWPVLALLPYIFLTYQSQVPSRHFYLASAGWVLVLSLLISLLSFRVRAGFLILFVSANVLYTWMRKDGQFEERAAPTNALIQVLKREEPGRLSILDFPLNPWIAILAACHVPGWNPDLISVDESVQSCPDCSRYRWNRKSRSYDPEGEPVG